ncbi:MAG: FHA domain-containing protein [Leptolyngbyaceae cyanobacterium MAG.088]|nr:FHA domain-containing protein [Leptolyngbyaceae cyanobacterium MAG.088]
MLSSILIVEDNQGKREIELDDPVYSVGRDVNCNVRLTSQFVSRYHATLVQLPNHDGSFYYRILDGNLKGKTSANGLLINGRKLQSHDLKNEDEIILGPQVRAVYYQLKRDAIATVPSDDEFEPNDPVSCPWPSYPFTPVLGIEVTPDNGESHIL